MERSYRTTNAYLVGGGIVSPAAAAFMIRDGRPPGGNVSILALKPHRRLAFAGVLRN